MKFKFLRIPYIIKNEAIIGIIRIMKISFIFIFIFSFQLLALETKAQDAVIELKTNSMTVGQLINEIEKQTNYLVVYSNREIDVARKVDVQRKSDKVSSYLNEVFAGTDISYDFENDYIVLLKKNNNNPEVVADIIRFSQQNSRTISGRVTDASGSPLPGVTVLVKGTNMGTITSVEGNYTLKNVPDHATLIFSFVGMETQENIIGNREKMDIVMQEKSVALDEIVAVGYGTMKKRDLTGSISSIKNEDISAFPSTTINKALQGRVAGVQVQQNSGSPGSNIQIRIRGNNSIMGSNEPLWVIDGFPGDPGMLNSSDVENIEILKDASATAIYGSRGANGVIIVTTKSGREGTTRVDYEYSYSVNKLIKKLDLMNAKEYAQFINLTRTNDNLGEYFSKDDINNLGNGTDWQDLSFRNAPIQQHYLSITGGNNRTKILVSGGYYDENGIVINSGYRRITLKSNIEHKISNKTKVLFNTILNRSDTNSKDIGGYGSRGSSLFGSITSAPPIISPYADDGTYTLLAGYYPFSSNSQINPIAYLNEVMNKSYFNRVNANAAFIFEPINGLSIKISGNVINRDTRNDNYTTKKYPASTGSASVSTNQDLNLNSDNIITYNKIINKKHNLNLTGGITYEKAISTSLGASGTGFLSDVTETSNLGSAATLGTPYTSFSDWTLLSYLGRVNYSYMDKYLLTVTFRADGSSRYNAGNKWGYFPSGALAWRVSEEDFLKNNNVISNLKLRAGYGETGSTAINPYYTMDMLSSGKTVFGNDLYTYFAPGTRLPSNLKWETTSQLDVGIDLGLLKNRIRLTVDYYNKLTRDLLNSVQLPSSLGYTTTVQNVGKIKNYGVDFQLETDIISNHEWQWNLTGNISINRNKVVELYNGQDIFGMTTSSLVVFVDNFNILREGAPFGSFYGYKENGYDENGKIKYMDFDGIEGISPADKTIIGNPNPDFIYGISSNLSWKNFNLNIFFQGSKGNDIISLSMVSQAYDYGYGLNTFKELLYNNWTPENPNSKYPKISSKTSIKMSDRFVYDGSYLRLKNIQLSYDIPSKLSWLKKAQVYISGQNLFTVTSYPWWDPEINTLGGSNSINQGVDWNSYPSSKGGTIGVKLSF